MTYKILFLTPARYPTEKAYGVTTGNTVRALRQIGKKIEIWNHCNEGIDEYGNPLKAVARENLISRKLLYRITFLRMDRWFFYFNQLFFSLKCRKRMSREKNLLQIWSRFPLVILICCFRRNVNQALIELHHQPSRIKFFFIMVIQRLKKPVTVAVISRKAEEQFESLGLNIPTVVLEMAVSDDFIQNPELALPLPVKICFLGKSQSSGKSNDLDFVIEAFSKMHNPDNVKLEFVGVEDDAMIILRQLAISKKIPGNNVIFTSHIPHSNVSKFLDSVSIGLVPYELNGYNAGRFPIKIMEYAAKGIWILAPKSFADNLKLDPNIVISYKDGDASELARKLEILSIEITKAKKRNESAIRFAKLHTYILRARKVDEHLEKLSLQLDHQVE